MSFELASHIHVINSRLSMSGRKLWIIERK